MAGKITIVTKEHAPRAAHAARDLFFQDPQSRAAEAAERERRYAGQVDDTSAAAQRRYLELLRLKSPQERLAIAVRLSRAVRELAVAGVKQRQPQATAHDIRRGLAERLYGSAIAERLFPSRG